MIRSVRRHLSFANTVAAVALFVALGGTVYASGRLSGKEIRPGSTPGNRLEKNSVTGAQVRESSLKAVPLAKGAEGLAGSGWGRVSASGTLSEARGVASITHSPGQGLYCIRIAGNTPSQSPMLVSLDGSDGDTRFAGLKPILATALWFSSGTDCPTDSYEVRTGDFDFSGLHPESRFVDNAFSFFVP
jgi:hypothetical protein